MHLYKDYRQKVRKRALMLVNIIIGGDIAPKLHHYLQLLENLKINEGRFEEYYGEVKKIVNSFIIHWTEVMNNAVKEADKVTNVVDKSEIVRYVDNTIELHKAKQSDFEKFFLPIETPEEEQAFNEISILYDKYMQSLEDIRLAVIEMRNITSMRHFAKEHFAISLHKKNDIFAFTHTFIAVMLTRNVKEIRASLSEIVNRTRKNLRQLQERRDQELSDLLDQLYNKNKEHLLVSRKPWRSSIEIAEVQRSIDKLKAKIEGHKEEVLSRLEEEFNYWNEKLSEFNRIAKTIDDLNKIEEKVLEQQKTYLELRDAQIPKDKLKCWENMQTVFTKKLVQIDEKKKEAARTILSFFSVRGPDRIFYNDGIGRYYVDEYGHQVYFYDYGLKMCHVNCAGEFLETPDTEVYYYDTNGRYVLNDGGEKLYKIAPCTSFYRLIDDELVKCTVDCGHSERPNENCRMDMKNRCNIPTTLKTAPVDIKGKLDKKTALYLWDSFGHVLPEVLYEVASENPKNPIHCLAHKLLRYKYNKTLKEMQHKKDEAANYRAAVYQSRKAKTTPHSQALRVKKVHRSKPEDFDETESHALYGQQIARQEFIQSLMNMYE